MRTLLLRGIGLPLLLALAWATVAYGGGERKDAAPGQMPTVYFEGKGPDPLVRRFGRFLDIALDDYNLQKANSAKGADITIKARFKEDQESRDLYAPLIHFVLRSRDNKDQMVNLCNSVSTSESVFKEKINYLGNITLPDSKRHLSVYVDEASAKIPADLIVMLKKGLADSGYKVTGSPADADAQLKNLQLGRLAVPMRAETRSLEFEVFDRNATKFFYTSGSGTSDVRYLSPQPGLNLDKLPCWSTFENFQGETVETAFWSEASRIAKTIRKHVNEEEKKQKN
ncbi:MAG TPA: hypothetical protein VJV96_17405 [Candidatus Angelobacter sp.]|nr:hypothetical protein [Candidatus Angelobacter sp.]